MKRLYLILVSLLGALLKILSITGGNFLILIGLALLCGSSIYCAFFVKDKYDSIVAIISMIIAITITLVCYLTLSAILLELVTLILAFLSCFFYTRKNR